MFSSSQVRKLPVAEWAVFVSPGQVLLRIFNQPFMLRPEQIKRRNIQLPCGFVNVSSLVFGIFRILFFTNRIS